MDKAKPINEKTELVKERELEDLPVEVLVKIFNYLPNHDVRCGVALTCKEFQKICQDESLVTVKDLCIKGHFYWSYGHWLYGLRNICNVIDIIFQSKNLTTLKIKSLTVTWGLNDESIYELVTTALQVCPKLFHLEIVDTYVKSVRIDEDAYDAEDQGWYSAEDGYFQKIFESILIFGNGLSVINLKLYNDQDLNLDWIFTDYISRGCPKLKYLTFESLDSSYVIEISFWGLKSLSKGCKELKKLKFTKIFLCEAHLYPKNEVMKVFPNCNVEIKNCVKYRAGPFVSNEIIPYDDHANDVLDNFEGVEIEFMFTQIYGEE